MEVYVIEETTPPVTFIPLERPTSVLRKCFGFETRTDKKKRTEVVCKLCKKELKYTGGTSKLHFHLENHHQQEYETERSKVSKPLPLVYTQLALVVLSQHCRSLGVKMYHYLVVLTTTKI